ncbi:threonine/serine exporter family protein [Pseudotamlana carrageenivorans]|uniref:Threonine/serine exporter n=1 Tax=Pseudotamlana carrageenivorans TaxID=2069432 RepID=A0A2I7SM62_9FLAO|nr:threonine/serine exporter family protein [Tamlana carrageenivorans]AUS06991.1 threonine/serine exporter [Tamlana carrageenivorans]
MTEILLHLLEVSFWSGVAAVGFGILFNVPKQTILSIFILGFLAGLIKFSILHHGHHIALASLAAASFVGWASIPIAHKIHHPPVVFSIPTMIPMIPGYFAYETILSLMHFVFVETDPEKRLLLIDAMFSHGFKMIYVLIGLTFGVALPLLVMNKGSIKQLRKK